MTRHRRFLGLVVFALSTVILTSPKGLAQQYDLIDLGNSTATGINNSGQIVGWMGIGTGTNVYNGAVFWANSSSPPVVLSTYGSNTYAYGINNSGQIVGKLYSFGATKSDVEGSAVYWANSSSTPVELGTFRGIALNSFPSATSINDSGQIVGNGDGGTEAAVYWANSSSPSVDLGIPTGMPYTRATGINSSGQIIGYATGFVTNVGFVSDFCFWANSSSLPINLDTLGASTYGISSINNSGQMVGGASLYGAVFWANSSSPPVVLDTLGASVCYPSSINNSGQIVGMGFDANNGQVAVLWPNSSSPPINLNTLIPVKSGLILQSATAINDSGEIIGYGTDVKGLTHAFARNH